MQNKLDYNNLITCLICYYYSDDLEKFKIALNSIFTQKNIEFNVVLVVDGPVTIDASNYINSLNVINLQIIWIDKNVGHGEARRLGLENCKSKFIAIFDSDDYSYDNRLFNSYNYLVNNPKCAVVSSKIKEFWNSGITTIRDCSNYNFKYTSPVNQNSCMFSTEAYNNCGGYISWYHNEDTYLWMRFIIAGWEIGFIDTILTEVYFDENSLKRRRGVRYFKSESKLRYYMYKSNMINLFELAINVIIRFVIQVLLPYILFKYIYTWRRKK